jgi:SAM-dependent methyltransferase
MSNHLDYYQYQATARGVRSVADVERCAREKGHVYDRIVLRWLPSDREARVVELACGHGSFLYWLRERGFTHLTGVDSSAEQIAFARQVGAEVCRAGAIDWLAAQAPESVQALVAIDFIEHISRDDLMELLRQSSRVLVRGGRLILRSPNGDSPLVGMNLFNDITHVWTYTPNCLDTLARMHGFAQTSFIDESAAAIRDHRWLKVPLCRMSQVALAILFRAAARERVQHWSPNLWACLEK